MKTKKHGWDKEHWEYTCSDGKHPSYWKTITTSKEWGDWVKENTRKTQFDVWECEGCGWISENHWKAFCKFISRKTKIPYKGKIR